MRDALITEPARRPAPVSAAVSIMILMAAGGLANAVIGLAGMGGVVDRFRAGATRAGASEADIDSLAGLAWGMVIAGAVLAVVLAALLVTLALGNLRGSNGARIATWVVCGLGLLCGCCGLLAVVGQSALSWNISSDDPTAEDLTQALTDAYPGWWIGLSGSLSAAQALGYLVVALLLALPAAHRYFRKRPAPPVAPQLPTAPPPVAEVRDHTPWQPPAQP
jgi:hypothetical protein